MSDISSCLGTVARHRRSFKSGISALNSGFNSWWLLRWISDKIFFWAQTVPFLILWVLFINPSEHCFYRILLSGSLSWIHHSYFQRRCIFNLIALLYLQCFIQMEYFFSEPYFFKIRPIYIFSRNSRSARFSTFSIYSHNYLFRLVRGCRLRRKESALLIPLTFDFLFWLLFRSSSFWKWPL